MSSIISEYSQSKAKYLNCADRNKPCLFQLSDINKYFIVSGPQSNAIKVGDNIYLSTSKENFEDTMNLFSEDNTIPSARSYETSFLNLGKKIHLGFVGGDSSYITLQLVKRLNGIPESFGDSPSTAYIVTENMLLSQYGYGNNGRIFYIGAW